MLYAPGIVLLFWALWFEVVGDGAALPIIALLSVFAAIVLHARHAIRFYRHRRHQ